MWFCFEVDDVVGFVVILIMVVDVVFVGDSWVVVVVIFDVVDFEVVEVVVVDGFI